MSRKSLLTAAALSAALVLSACSGGSGSGGEGGGDGPVTLDYWAWGTAQPGLVEAWNAANPDIQVRLTDAGGGTDSSAKLLTSTRAGEAPDVAVVEYQTLPAMIVGDVATDITDLVPQDVTDAFPASTWDLTRFNDAVYGVPQDVGPQALVYNSARLAELGITVPTTWAEFTEAARAVRAADPNAYLATFNPGEFGFFAAMAQQAGASWWEVDGESWSVGIDSSESVAVADYWQQLIDEDLVKVEDLLTPQWNQELNAGQILSWPSALWAPGVISGVAPDMTGQWAMAPMPQWTPGDDRVAYQGGSATIVTTSSDHPEEAAEFAAWINTSQEGADIQLTTGQYPASTLGQTTAEGSAPPELMPQQTDFWTTASGIAQNTIPAITWGPNVNVASSAFQDAMAAAVRDGQPLSSALAQTQQAVVADMEKTGFDVSG